MCFKKILTALQTQPIYHQYSDIHNPCPECFLNCLFKSITLFLILVYHQDDGIWNTPVVNSIHCYEAVEQDDMVHAIFVKGCLKDVSMLDGDNVPLEALLDIMGEDADEPMT
ncbi:hypothetical protein EDD85DRAFT_798842 [Armillaria nabsnona]|nr:hypothetical protein EDD85DRAFT_798842 [Armillaria nabsnona]